MMPEPVSPDWPATTSIDTTEGSTLAAMAAYDCALLVAAEAVWVLGLRAAAATGEAAAELPPSTALATRPPVPPETSTRAVRPAVSLSRPRERWVGSSAAGCGIQDGGGGGGRAGPNMTLGDSVAVSVAGPVPMSVGSVAFASV